MIRYLLLIPTFFMLTGLSEAQNQKQISAKIISEGKFFNKNLNVAALGGSIGTEEEGISGMIVKLDSFSYISRENIDAKGKIVFYNEPFDQGMVNTFAAYGKAVKQRTRGAIEAAKRGAVGVIVRSVTSLNDNVPHTGIMYYQDSIPKIPAVSIGIQDAKLLSLALETRGNLEVQIKLSCINHDSTLSYNVIGEIYGRENPDEIIVVGGHFDAWDKGHGGFYEPETYRSNRIRPWRFYAAGFYC